MRFLGFIAAVVLTGVPCAAQSDVDVKDDVATRFTRSKGASLLGQTVHWHVTSKTFHLPKKTRAGTSLYVASGIGILTDAVSSAVEEVQRRGGEACVRGRVVKVPEKDRDPGDPAYAVVVHSLSHRKH